jgi:hypothetical protein
LPSSKDADRFMLHLYAALAEKERRLIAERTKAALAAKKAPEQVLEIPAIWSRPARWGERRWCAQPTNSHLALFPSFMPSALPAPSHSLRWLSS